MGLVHLYILVQFKVLTWPDRTCFGSVHNATLNYLHHTHVNPGASARARREAVKHDPLFIIKALRFFFRPILWKKICARVVFLLVCKSFSYRLVYHEEKNAIKAKCGEVQHVYIYTSVYGKQTPCAAPRWLCFAQHSGLLRKKFDVAVFRSFFDADRKAFKVSRLTAIKE